MHLRVRNFEYVILEAENLVARKYITALLQKKMSFRTYEERRTAGAKILKEVNQIKSFFTKIAPKIANRVDSPLEAIKSLAEVLKSEDSEILSLDLHALVDKFPDVTEDHLSRLLSLRGDMSRSEIREKTSFIFHGERKAQRNSAFTKSIFQQIA